MLPIFIKDSLGMKMHLLVKHSITKEEFYNFQCIPEEYFWGVKSYQYIIFQLHFCQIYLILILKIIVCNMHPESSSINFISRNLRLPTGIHNDTLVIFFLISWTLQIRIFSIQPLC